MDFAISDEGRMLEEQVVRFLNEKIIPAERTYIEQIAETPTVKIHR